MLKGWNGMVGGKRRDCIAARRIDGKILGRKRRGRTDISFWIEARRVEYGWL